MNGTPLVVVDGETGWLAPPEDPSALADAVVACLQAPDEATRRARNGRQLIEERFSADAMIDELEASLISQSGSRARRPRVESRTADPG